MYLSQILQYLMWPAMILVSYLLIKAALAVYEKKFPGNDNGN
jgi:hypothetical protein